MNYLTIEKDLLAVVFALDKFRTYLIGSPFIIFIDHATFRYLLSIKDAKEHLIRWILLLLEFDLTIKEKKKGVKNVVADHLSHPKFNNSTNTLAIRDEFPDEYLFAATMLPWYAHIANYLVISKLPSTWSM